MNENSRRLSLFEAAAVVAGLGFGGGVMAVPYLASLNGIMDLIIIALVAYAFSLLLHLMVVEVVLREDKPQQLVELFGKYVFKKTWWGKALTWLIFALVLVTFYALLAGYIVGCAELLSNLFPALPLWAGEVITYVIAAGIVLAGLKAVGVSEKWSIISIAIVLLVLSIISFSYPFNILPLWSGDAAKILALYGMVMFCLTCLFSVPQAAEGLSWNKKLVPGAVVLGITINLIFTLVISFMASLVSKPVTEVAIIGWGNAVGTWALILGSVFAFLGLLTSYWSIGYALAVVIVERLRWGYRLSWLAATVPGFLMAIFGLAGFLEYMRYAGGAMAVLMALLIPPALLISRKENANIMPAFSMGKWGNIFICVLVFIAYLLMAVGSLIPVN
ncbi:MAG: aromatic amino acid transport family protein [Dehalococcoidia bacterium]|nr:aromatic amino acid transport family protein [Dehalococcoidia bacterium]